MKITIAVDRYYPYIGGIEQYVRGLSVQMRKDGHQVTIITSSAPGALSEETGDEGLILRTPLLEGAVPEPGRALSHAGEISKLIQETAPDVVYANNHASLGSIRAAQMADVPVVYGCHGWGLMCPSKIRLLKPSGELCQAETSYGACMKCYASGPAPLKIKLPGFAKQAGRVRRYVGYHGILDSADARIGMSRLVAKMFREQSNTHAIHPGIDLDAYRPVESGKFRERFGVRGEYVLVPGRVNPIKGQMDALMALRETGLDLTMVFAGNVALDPSKRADTGDYGAKLAAAADEMGLSKRVVFTGMLDQPEMAAAYSGATATLVPSVWSEPFGYVAAESMACETPVIITRNSGAAELIDDTVGQVVPRQDPEAMARAMERVISQSEALGRAARRRAEERLAWPKVARQVADVLREAANRRVAAETRAA
jgi:glycosyltransferase involved in cell wall biosynthesis